MFGRWSRQKNKPSPPIALPDLDDQVTAHWNRGAAPPLAPPANAQADSLEFDPAPAYRAGKTKEHRRGRRRFLVSLLLGLALAPIAVAGAYYLMRYINPVRRATESLGERMTFGQEDQEEIFYTEDISSDEVRRLGSFLQREGLFGDSRLKSVRLSKDGDNYVVGFALEWNNWRDDNVAADFRDLLPRLSRGAFNGRPVEIHLCARQPDSKGRAMPTMRVIRADVER